MACCSRPRRRAVSLPASPWHGSGRAPLPWAPSCPVCIHPAPGHFTALHCHPHAQYCYLHDGAASSQGGEGGALLVAGQICFIPGWARFRVLRRLGLPQNYTPTSARTAFGPCRPAQLGGPLRPPVRPGRGGGGLSDGAWPSGAGRDVARSAQRSLASQPAPAAGQLPGGHPSRRPGGEIAAPRCVPPTGSSSSWGAAFASGGSRWCWDGRASCSTGGSTLAQIADRLGYEIPAPCPAPSSALPGANRRPEGALSPSCPPWRCLRVAGVGAASRYPSSLLPASRQVTRRWQIRSPRKVKRPLTLQTRVPPSWRVARTTWVECTRSPAPGWRQTRCSPGQMAAQCKRCAGETPGSRAARRSPPGSSRG